jgi:hypothetical protein
VGVRALVGGVGGVGGVRRRRSGEKRERGREMGCERTEVGGVGLVVVEGWELCVAPPNTHVCGCVFW